MHKCIIIFVQVSMVYDHSNIHIEFMWEANIRWGSLCMPDPIIVLTFILIIYLNLLYNTFYIIFTN